VVARFDFRRPRRVHAVHAGIPAIRASSASFGRKRGCLAARGEHGRFEANSID